MIWVICGGNMLFFLIGFGALIGFLIARLFLYFIFQPEKKTSIMGFSVMGLIPFLIQRVKDDLALEGKVDGLIEEKVDGFFDKIKQQIPMAEAFLSGDLEDRIKVQAQEEFGSIVPQLNNQITSEEGAFSSRSIEAKVKADNPLFSSGLSLIGAGIGALLGLVGGIIHLIF